MFRDPVLKILTDILISWETIVVIFGFIAIFFFFVLSKKKHKQTSDSSPTTKIYSDLYSLNDMYKKGLMNLTSMYFIYLNVNKFATSKVGIKNDSLWSNASQPCPAGSLPTLI